MMIHVSRCLAIAVKWANRHGQAAVEQFDRRWSGELSRTSEEAMAVAKRYGHFEGCFQGFHKNLYAAEVLDDSLIRFTVRGSERDRQVSAHQKGLRPQKGKFGVQQPQPRPQTPRVQVAFEAVVRSCRPTGSLGFECGDSGSSGVSCFPNIGRDRRRSRGGPRVCRWAITDSMSSTRSMHR